MKNLLNKRKEHIYFFLSTWLFVSVAEESKAATWVGSREIFLVNEIAQESTGEHKLVQELSRLTSTKGTLQSAKPNFPQVRVCWLAATSFQAPTGGRRAPLAPEHRI